MEYKHPIGKLVKLTKDGAEMISRVLSYSGIIVPDLKEGLCGIIIEYESHGYRVRLSSVNFPTYTKSTSGWYLADSHIIAG